MSRHSRCTERTLDASAAGLVTQAGPVLHPEQVAETVVEGMAQERFLILPHPEVQGLFARKASDHDRWIAGMQVARGLLGARRRAQTAPVIA